MLNLRRLAGLAVLLSLVAGACAATVPLAGVWRDDGANSTVRIGDGEIISSTGDQLSVVRVLRRNGDEFVVRNHGIVETWRIHADGGVLRMVRPAGESRYVRVTRDAEFALTALDLPAPTPLSPGDVERVMAMVNERFEEDQAVRKDRSRLKDAARVSAENRAFLVDTATKIGWIDVGRFGTTTSYRAVILAKHSGDLPLLLGALRYAERDFARPGPNAQAFAILYDELQLRLGRQQRFGTQVCRAYDGIPLVCSLETPSAVDARRAGIGLPPLSDYLQTVSKVLYNGAPVRIPADDELQ